VNEYYLEREREKAEYQLWLNSLNVGDKVALESYGGWARSEAGYKIVEISRITPTRRIMAGGYTFTKDGKPYGKSYSGSRSSKLKPVTQEVHDAIKRKKLIYELHKVRIDSLTLDQLEAFDKIVNPEPLE